jgi:hypothetical protein
MGCSGEPVIKRFPQPCPGADQVRVQFIVPVPALAQELDQDVSLASVMGSGGDSVVWVTVGDG